MNYGMNFEPEFCGQMGETVMIGNLLGFIWMSVFLLQSVSHCPLPFLLAFVLVFFARSFLCIWGVVVESEIGFLRA